MEKEQIKTAEEVYPLPDPAIITPEYNDHDLTAAKREGYERAMQDYADQQSMEVAKRQWVSVKTALPEIDNVYIVHSGGIVSAAYYWNFCGKDCFWGVDEEVENITHWMALPEPPIIEEVKTKQP